MTSVSVLMPCYNTASTLEEAITSLERQSFTGFETVVVDDGSSDSTPQILREWAARDNRVTIISQPHLGIVQALNSGLESCHQPYIARMDSDDRSRPERLARQVDFLDQHPEVAVVGSLVSGFPPDQVRQGFRIYIDWLNSLVSDADIRREIFVESPVAHPSALYRKEWVEHIGGYQEHGWPEDYDLWLRLYLAGAHFAKVPEVLLDWREHPGRLTRTDGRYSLENFIKAKSCYLACGPLAGRDAIIVWGAGMMGRRLSKHLLRQGLALASFIDVDPRKIGRTRRGLPIQSPENLPSVWKRYNNPAVVAAVGARSARAQIRSRLEEMGLREGQDWWSAA